MELVTDDPTVVGASTPDRSTRTRPRPGLGLGALELVVVATVALVPVAAIPQFAFPMVPRLALLLLLGPLGLAVLARQARRGDRAGIALVAVLGSASVSAVLAEAPWQAFKGNIVSWMSVVVYAAAAGWWAIGRQLGARARAAIPRLLLAGAAINALVGVAQITLDVSQGVYGTFAGRAAGLLSNPAYYGSFMAGLTAWWTVESGRSTGRRVLATVLALAFATGMSGSRAALAAVLVVATGGLAVWRHRRALETWLAAALGFVLSTVFTNAVSTRGRLDRLATGEPIGGRADIWRFGLQAFAERPLFGWGFDHFDAALGQQMTPEFVARYSYNDLDQPWVDPHNITLMLLVSLGAVGLVLIAAFVVLAVRGTVEPAFLAAAMAIAATWQLQPATLETLPLGLLFLGLAVRPRGAVPAGEADVGRSGLPARRTAAVTLGAGLALALYVLVSTFALQAAARADRPEAVASRVAWFHEDPYAEAYAGRQFDAASRQASDPVESERLTRQAIGWARRAAETTDEPRRWNRVAELHLVFGEGDLALDALERALNGHPWNPTSHRLLLLVALAVDDPALLESALDDACRMGLDACESSLYRDALP